MLGIKFIHISERVIYKHNHFEKRFILYYCLIIDDKTAQSVAWYQQATSYNQNW